ncbi:MAG: isoprenyl transferase [Alphaproteobacteria bacterium]|nr:isoprenyl transferase [Alphaproteobacteria bacterium]
MPLPETVLSSNLPKHIAIIMDGNGRWAKSRNLPTIAGHKAGAEMARRITEYASKMGIKYLTLYTFSSENWLREKSWIDDFMGLLRWYLRNEFKELMRNGVRIQVIGDRTLFAKDIQELISETEEKTKNNTAITVLLALSYGSRDEITRTFKKLAHKVKAGDLDPSEITVETISENLDTADFPDPDLLIRTSGEKRISNFLLWQMAYTEFVFVPDLWPDFSEEGFEKAIYEYQQRGRRYGLYTSS